MSNKVTIGVAVAAGLAGGMLTRYITPPAVHAQAPSAQTQTAPDELRAKNFVLVDRNNQVVGTFTVEPPSDHAMAIGVSPGPHIVLKDAQGRLIHRFSGTGLY